MGGVWVGKPNLVKDFCPMLPLDLDFGLGLGQAFQYKSLAIFLMSVNLSGFICYCVHLFNIRKKLIMKIGSFRK